jgi:putative transposase
MNSGKLRPIDRINNEIKSMLSGIEDTEDAIEITSGEFLSRLIKKSAIKILQEAMEEEVQDYLGRGYYERKQQEEFKGYRNGYEPHKLKTAEGKITVEVPQIRESEEPYRSKIIKQAGNKTSELERLAREMYIRGLSTRDIEDTFRASDGEEMLSKDAVSKLTEKLNEEYEEFISRDLSNYDVIYMFVDGVYEGMGYTGTKKEAILCAWAIISDGRKVMLHLAVGNKESCSCCKDFFENMLQRGLREPLMVISDGASGLKKAIDESFSESKRQRCLAHKLRNIANKLSEKGLSELMPRVRNVYNQADKGQARELAIKLIDTYAREYPSAIRSFQDDLESTFSFMEFPIGHHRYIKTTNLLERCFEELRRRTKVVPRFFSEKSCMKLTFGTLIRVSEKWSRIKMQEIDLARLRNIREIMGWKESEDNFISRKKVA